MASKFYPRCKKNGSESDLSPLSSFDVKNGSAILLFPLYVFAGYTWALPLPVQIFLYLHVLPTVMTRILMMTMIIMMISEENER